MSEQDQRQFDDLRRRLTQTEERVFALEHMTIAPESGGGALTVSSTNSVLRIDSLTDESVQMP